VTDPDLPDPTGDVAARRRMVAVTAVGAVVAAALLFALVARGMGTGSGPGRAGDGGGAGARTALFDVGKADDRAAGIARSGPILFPDPQGRSRDIYVQHLGGSDWVAFEARVAGASRQCALRWEHGARHFVDPCDGRVFPPEGTGLVTFPAEVDDEGRVIVDLGSPTAPPAP
jgi:hypothetical protein